MRAASLEELRVYQKAHAAADEVSLLLKRSSFREDRRLRDQLSASSDAVPSLIADGFGQSTDRFFAQLCYRARGESKETRSHLRVACGRDYISKDELARLTDGYNEIEKMLTGLIRHLEEEDRKHRG